MFRISRADIEGNLNVSKWLHIQVLLDSSEIRYLFQEMGNFYLVKVGCVVPKEKPLLSHEEFFRIYDHYIHQIQRGYEPELSSYQAAFSCALSTSLDSFYAMEVAKESILVKPSVPVVQSQAHSMGYSLVEEKVYPMMRGSDVIEWGLQLSFPTLYQGKKERNPRNTLTDESFANARLFQAIQKWMRVHTRPTPIMVRKSKMNLPVRIGNQCFSWVNNHPMLRFHGLMVENEGDEG